MILISDCLSSIHSFCLFFSIPLRFEFGWSSLDFMSCRIKIHARSLKLKQKKVEKNWKNLTVKLKFWEKNYPKFDYLQPIWFNLINFIDLIWTKFFLQKWKCFIVAYAHFPLFFALQYFHFSTSKLFQTGCRCLATFSPSVVSSPKQDAVIFTPALYFPPISYPLPRGPLFLDPITLIRFSPHLCI